MERRGVGVEGASADSEWSKRAPGSESGAARSGMPYDAGGNGARARSARIRTSHDYEATQLEEMRRRSVPLEPRPRRHSLLTRLSGAFGHMSRRSADVKETEAIASTGHVE